MLVQARERTYRLVRQHDHGLLAGLLAGAWAAPPRPTGLPWSTVVAASLHDVVWGEVDRTPRLDPATGRPHDFISLPDDVRERMLGEGLDRLARVDPTMGGLVREHHEALRRDRPARGEAAWIRFTDLLSLHICLTTPGADAASLPGWLAAPSLTAPAGGPSLSVTWIDDAVLRIDPFPFRESELHLTFPCREIPRRAYADDADLRGAWESAPVEELALRAVR